MDTYREFCIRFWEATRELDLYSMEGSQLDRLIVDALLKTNGGKELKKTSMNELSVLIRAINHNNRKIYPPSLPSNLDEVAEKYANRGISSYADPYEEIKAYQADKDAFKAGAEWMDGQGINIESNVVLTQEEDTCRPYLALQDFGYMPAPKFCKESDKVIIQIRKK